MAKIHSETKLIVSDPQGNRFPMTLRNLGWSESDKSYVTEFEFQNHVFVSLFRTGYYVDEHCDQPQLRLNHDESFMYDELGLAIEELVE